MKNSYDLPDASRIYFIILYLLKIIYIYFYLYLYLLKITMPQAIEYLKKLWYQTKETFFWVCMGNHETSKTRYTVTIDLLCLPDVRRKAFPLVPISEDITHTGLGIWFRFDLKVSLRYTKQWAFLPNCGI